MAFPLVDEIKFTDGSGGGDGVTVVEMTFDSMPKSGDSIVWAWFGRRTAGTSFVLLEKGAEWTTTIYTAGGALQGWEIYHQVADGFTDTFRATMNWNEVTTGLFFAHMVKIQNVDSDDPIESFVRHTYDTNPFDTSVSNGVETDILTTAFGTALLLKLGIFDDDFNSLAESPISFGESISTTHTGFESPTVASDRLHIIKSFIANDAGSSGSAFFDFNSPPSGLAALVMVEFNADTTPGLGSIRQLPLGWSHIPGFETEAWADEGRVITWGNVRRKVSNAGRGFSNGIDALELADTDFELWGSTFDSGGTPMLWRPLQINSRWVNSIYGTVAGTTPLAYGRVVEFEHAENKVTLGLYDGMDEISNAQFVWDYEALWSTTSLGYIYGNVYAVYGSNIIVEEHPGNGTLRRVLTGRVTRDGNTYRTHTEKWTRLESFGALGTDSLLPGDEVKFYPYNKMATVQGGTELVINNPSSLTLRQEPAHIVQSGSFFVNTSSGNRQGTFGTIELQSPPVGVGTGDFIFKKLPLWYRGNPAEIVRELLTGTNTTLSIGTGVIDSVCYQAATSACSPMFFESLITNDGQGAVLQSIKEISEAVDAVFFFDRHGSFCWTPFRPRTRDAIDFVAERYDGTIFGGTAGTGNMWGARWNTDISDVVTDMTVNFNFNHYEDEEIPNGYIGNIVRQNLNTATHYRGYRNASVLDSKWVKHLDDAVVIAERKLRMATVARGRYEFQTSLYGIEQELYDLLLLTHRTGSLKDRAWQVDETTFDIDGDLISFSLNDISDVYFGKGYGYYEDGAVSSHAVSGTTRCGWGWAQTNHGTIGSIALGSLGTLVVLFDENGDTPDIGEDGYTRWFTVGSEVLYVTSTSSGATKTVERGADVSDVGTHSSIGIGWAALPQDENGDLLALWNGTEFSGSRAQVSGTVLNITTGTWGTVWRFW